MAILPKKIKATKVILASGPNFSFYFLNLFFWELQSNLSDQDNPMG